MWKFFVVIAAIWLALLPPFFTKGECTAEFDRFNTNIEQHSQLVSTVDSAQKYFGSIGVPYESITAEACQRVKPRFLDSCGSGTVIYAKVPIENRVCRIYRDDSIQAQFHFDRHQRMYRRVIDMASYKKLPLPWGGEITWAK